MKKKRRFHAWLDTRTFWWVSSFFLYILLRTSSQGSSTQEPSHWQPISMCFQCEVRRPTRLTECVSLIFRIKDDFGPGKHREAWNGSSQMELPWICCLLLSVGNVLVQELWKRTFFVERLEKNLLETWLMMSDFGRVLEIHRTCTWLTLHMDISSSKKRNKSTTRLDKLWCFWVARHLHVRTISLLGRNYACTIAN